MAKGPRKPKRSRGFAEEPATMEAAEEGPFDAVMEAAGRLGWLKDKTARVACRVNPAMLARAKKRTGIKNVSDLIAFALAQLALEDEFAETMRRLRGSVDPSLKLGY